MIGLCRSWRQLNVNGLTAWLDGVSAPKINNDRVTLSVSESGFCPAHGGVER
jgi:hypothetical protein